VEGGRSGSIDSVTAMAVDLAGDMLPLFGASLLHPA
jgi:hypothetical protein